jgi:hypothetical protein
MDFYNSRDIKNPYNNNGSMSYGEPDLRKELAEILYNEKRGQYLIYRRVRKDLSGHPILAPSTLTNRSAEATFGTNKGMKYLFDDHLIIGYISQGSVFHETGSIKEYGDSRTDKNVLYLEHDAIYKMTNSTSDMPETNDKILVPELDINGNLVSPLKCWMRYDLGSPESYRLDSRGRVEFFKINLISNMDDGIQL